MFGLIFRDVNDYFIYQHHFVGLQMPTFHKKTLKSMTVYVYWLMPFERWTLYNQ